MLLTSNKPFDFDADLDPGILNGIFTGAGWERLRILTGSAVLVDIFSLQMILVMLSFIWFVTLLATFGMKHFSTFILVICNTVNWHL